MYRVSAERIYRFFW